MKVVLGNIRDPQMRRLASAAERLRSVRRRAGPVWNASTGALEDETGLTVHHEIDPRVQEDLHRLSDGIKSSRKWMFALGGLIVGLLLAGIVWWMTRNNRTLTG